MRQRKPDYTVVSDFRANGATRGSLFPVIDMAGEVLRPRKPGDPIDDLPKPDIQPSRQKQYPKSVMEERRAANLRIVADRKKRVERRNELHRSRLDLCMTYDRGDTPGRMEYFAGVYCWVVGEPVSTPCGHRHRSVYAAIWCNDFPASKQPKHVVVVDVRSGRVKSSVLPESRER